MLDIAELSQLSFILHCLVFPAGQISQSKLMLSPTIDDSILTFVLSLPSINCTKNSVFELEIVKCYDGKSWENLVPVDAT